LNRAKLFENIKKIQSRIAAACLRAGRNPKDIVLVAVTKQVDPANIIEAHHFGLTNFGENTIQEASLKISTLKVEANWHFIGHLQKNKLNKAISLNFSLIQSIDSLELAQLLDEKLRPTGAIQNVLLEINIAKEPQKHGFDPQELPLVFEEISKLKNIKPLGLMTMGPEKENSEAMRPYFREAKKIFDSLTKKTPLEILSMGMSNNFEVAIEEGATMVRVGRAMFEGE